MKKSTLKRRIKQASALCKELDDIFRLGKTVPSYRGRGRFIDKITDARRKAEALVTNLGMDLDYMD